MSKHLYRKQPAPVETTTTHAVKHTATHKKPKHTPATHKITPAERQRAWRAADPQRAAIQRERNRISMAAKRAAAKKQK